MAFDSMTGFARAGGSYGPTSWHWEVRSVNGRGLDVRLRLPPGLDGLEPRIREAVAQRFRRGSIQVSLNARREEGTTEVRLNEAVLGQVLKAAERVRAVSGGEPIRVDALLGLRGVLEAVETVETEADAAARTEAMLASLETALAGVADARRAEGGRLAKVVRDQLAEIEALVKSIAASPARTVEAIRARLAEQIGRLLDASSVLDAGRLHQEAALLATRADVEEELKRLTMHLASARELIAGGNGAGRKLDFLAQEFNREANTLCSKANDGEIARAGLALKAVIDQMREQVQNIE